jgi:hypothetical protein
MIAKNQAAKIAKLVKLTNFILRFINVLKYKPKIER